MRHARFLIDLLCCFSSHKSDRYLLPTRISTLTAPQPSSSQLPLVPISTFRNEITFLDQETATISKVFDKDGCYRAQDGQVYQLGLAEEQDLPDVARFVVATFGAEVIRVSRDFGSLERLLLQPAVDVVNGYSGLVAFAEVLSGLRQRLSGRLQPHSSMMGLSLPLLDGSTEAEVAKKAASHAIVLVLGKARSDSDWQLDIVGSVELQLQICDAKIPFTLPGLDAIERRMGLWLGASGATSNDRTSTMTRFQPYLSNLCVAEAFRCKGVGRALVRCVEDIAATQWKASSIYLHVDPDNASALNLYRREGYRDAGRRWRPFWAGKAAEIIYFVKWLQ